MELNFICATGNFLQNYHSDLRYFSSFQAFKIDQSDIDAYCDKGLGTFKNFINDYRVARNTDKSKTKELVVSTLNWLSSNKTINVDRFAAYLKMKKLTHGKTATSLASKILFLSDPWNIFPYDSQAKSALNPKMKTYAEYYDAVMNFKMIHLNDIENGLNLINNYVQIIEYEYKRKLFKVELIRSNRFIDKILWSNGRNINNH